MKKAKKKAKMLTLVFIIVMSFVFAPYENLRGDTLLDGENEILHIETGEEVAEEEVAKEGQQPQAPPITEPQAVLEAEPMALPEEEAPPVINVAMPISVDFVIDPFELGENGQVYSKDYTVENYGETEVVVYLSNFNLEFKNDYDFELLSEPFVFDWLSEGGLKSIYLSLSFGRDDIAPIVLTGDYMPEEIAIPLSACGTDGSVLTMNFSGSVNPFPDEEWCNGDVRFAMAYRISADEDEAGGYSDNFQNVENVLTPEEINPPEDPIPEDPTTEDPTTEDPTPEDPTPEDPTPEDPTPEDPTPEDPTPEDPTTEDPTTEDPTTEDPTPEDPTPEDPTTEDPTTEDPTTEEPPAEDPTPEDPKPDSSEPEPLE